MSESAEDAEGIHPARAAGLWMAAGGLAMVLGVIYVVG